MAPGCERSRPVVAGPGGAYAVALRSMHGGLCPVSCAPSPVSRAPCPCPRPRFTCSAFRVLRPAPHARVFRVPHPRPAPRAPHPRPRTLRPCPCPRLPRPAPRARARGSVFCVPRTVARVPRPVSPPALRGRSFRLLQAAGMKRKSGGLRPPDLIISNL